MTKHTKRCPECQGWGTQTFERVHRHSASNDSGFIEEYEDECENCGGVGQIDDDLDDDDDDDDDDEGLDQDVLFFLYKNVKD